MNILVDLDDEVIEKYELTPNECLFLSWFINFYGYGKGKVIVKDNKRYLWVTYNKILNDIKTLRRKKQQAVRIVSRLSEIGLIDKYVINRNRLYLWPNFDRISNNEYEYQKCLSEDDLRIISDIGEYQKCIPIIKYNKKYIKIISNKENIAEIDGNEFLEELKNRLNRKIGKVAFDCIFYDSNVHLIADKLIILKVGCSTLVQNNEEIFKQKVQEVIDELTS